MWSHLFTALIRFFTSRTPGRRAHPWRGVLPLAAGLALLLPVGVALLPPAQVAHAATVFTVNSNANDSDLDDGDCTLREAIDAARTGPSDDCTATGSGSPTRIEFSVSGSINLDSSLPTLDTSLEIVGPGSGTLTVQRNTTAVLGFRIFSVSSGATVTISDLTLANGQIDSGTTGGGAIYVQNGTLNLEDSIVKGNTAPRGGAVRIASGSTLNATRVTFGGTGEDDLNEATSDDGGAIFNDGTLVLEDSDFLGNIAATNGGAVYNNTNNASNLVRNSTFTNNLADNGGALYNAVSDQITVRSSTFENNTASAAGGGGGALLNAGSALLTVINSTFTDNQATGAGSGGGGIWNNGTLTLANATFSGNQATTNGGGVYNTNLMDIRNTIITGSPSGGDCNNAIGTLQPGSTKNLIDDGSCGAEFTGDPLIGALASNGGPTETHALLPGSPAIRAGDSATCNSAALTDSEDQRGSPRPTATCDIGAYQTIVVSASADTTSNNGTCTLREAIAAANGNSASGSSAGECAAGTGVSSDSITFHNVSTVNLTSALPDITSDMVISGPGTAALTVQRSSGTFGLFTVTSAANDVTMEGFTIANGNTAPGNDGGGIINDGTLTLNLIRLENNSAQFGDGGAVYNTGSLNMNQSTVTGSAADDGGGIANVDGGQLTVRSSTFENNDANDNGAAIFNRDSTLNVYNSTLSANTAAGDGGGLYTDDGSINVVNSTLYENSANNGGGIYNRATMSLRNTIVAGSTSGGDCRNVLTIATNLNNLIEDGVLVASGGCSTTSQQRDPLLEPLADNGGPTETHALIPGSPAMDAGNLAACENEQTIDSVDQRGVARPQDGDADGDSQCDIGSFEYDLPLIGLPDDTITYVENSAPIIIESGAIFNKADQEETSMRTLTVDFPGGSTPEDILSLTSASGITISENNITLNSEIIGTFTDGASLTVNFNAGTITPEAVQSILRAVTYENTSDALTTGNTREVRFKLTGIGPDSNEPTKQIVFEAQNDAPVLNNTGDPSLSTIPEKQQPSDDASNLGTTVIAILESGVGDSTITDPDPGAVEGIAVIGVDNTNGVWQYDPNGGTNWLPFPGNIGPGSGVLLIPGSKIRFVPDIGFNGTVDQGITFRAWDRTTGNNGQTGVNTAPGGGTSAFSSATETASITVDTQNDAPVLNSAGDATFSSINEDETDNNGNSVQEIIDSVGGDGGIDMITDNDPGAREGIAITAVNNSNGTWEYSTDSGLTWQPFGSVSDVQALLLAPGARVRFVPNTDFSGDVDPGITFRAWDQSDERGSGTTASTSPNGGSTAFSVDKETARIEVVRQNDAPMLDTSGLPFLDTIPQDVNDADNDGTLVSTLLSRGANGDPITDPDGPDEGIAVVSADNSNGTWQYKLTGSGSWQDFGSVSTSAAVLLKPTATVRFVPNAGYSGTVNPGITLRAWDQSSGSEGDTGVNTDGNNSGGTAAFSVGIDAAFISVDSLGNDAPSLDVAGEPFLDPIIENVADNENTGNTVATILSRGEGGDPIIDPDAGALDGIAVVEVDNTNGTWQYDPLGGTNWQGFGSLSETSAVLLTPDATIRFVPNTDFFGAVDGLSFRAWDQTDGRSNGSVAVDTTTNGGDTSFSTAIEVASITVEEENEPPQINATDPVTVDMDEDGSPQAFDLTLTATDSNNDVLTWSISSDPSNGSASASGTGTSKAIEYTPASDYNGTDSFEVRVSDDGGAFDTVTVNVNIAPVNDAPEFSIPAVAGANISDGLKTIEGFASELRPGPVTATDESGQSLSFNVTVQSTSGGLTLVTAPSIDPATGDLTFQAADGSSGEAIVEVTLSDNGGTANGGDDTSDTQTFTIRVRNTPPTVTPYPTIQVPVNAPNTEIDLTEVFDDEQDGGDGLTYAIVGNTNPDLFTLVTIDSSGTLIIDYAPNQSGTAVITVRATDTTGLSTETTFTVEVGGGPTGSGRIFLPIIRR